MRLSEKDMKSLVGLVRHRLICGSAEIIITVIMNYEEDYSLSITVITVTGALCVTYFTCFVFTTSVFILFHFHKLNHSSLCVSGNALISDCVSLNVYAVL